MQELSHLSGRCALEPVLHPMMWLHDICVTIACIASRPGAEPLAAVRRRGGALPSASLSHKSRAARRSPVGRAPVGALVAALVADASRPLADPSSPS